MMDDKRRKRVFEDDPAGSDSDEDFKPKKRSIADGLIDKLDFDNIPDDIPLGFQPMGMPANPFADKINQDEGEEDTGPQKVSISDYNDIFKQVEKDLGVKGKSKPGSSDVNNSTAPAEKVSFPLVPGQNLASLEELTKDLEKARGSKNHKVIVSLCSTCSKKVTDPQEKVEYLAEKFRSLEALNLPKLCEGTANEILLYDPQNVRFKFYQTKLLIENSQNIWDSQIEYLRARSLIEQELSKGEDYDLLSFLGELEQIHYSLQIKIEKQKASSNNYMQIGGSNINSTVGIGTDESTSECYVSLDELYSKKISSIATGDFHTLIICENLAASGSEDGVNTDIGNTDVIAFGLNQQGQVNSIPSEESIKTPKIVPFFIGKRPRLVAACRARSVAMTEDGRVYEWGFLGDEKAQFNILHDFSGDKEFLKSSDEVIDIKCGLEYTLFLTKFGKVYFKGVISQLGEFVFETEEMILLNSKFGKSSLLDFAPSFAKDFIKSQMGDPEEEKKEIFVVKMDAGYSHCMFLDSEGMIYVFGAGHYGQLGLGFDDIKAKNPVILEELNDGFNKIVSISCGANCCIAYTELGLLYSWGMLNDGQPDTITYYPTVLGVPDSIMLSHINAQSREIMACDVKGDLYRCDLEFRRRLERVEKSVFLDKTNPDFFIRKVFCGRSMRILLDSLLSPERCFVEQKCEVMETLVENEVVIELRDILNQPFSMSDEQREEIYKGIRVMFTQDKDFDLSYFKISEYNPQVQEEEKISKPKKKEIKNSKIVEKISTKKAASTAVNFNPKKKKLATTTTKPKKPKNITKPQKPTKPISRPSKRPETTKSKPKPKIPNSASEETKAPSEASEGSLDQKPELLYPSSVHNLLTFKIYEADPETPTKITFKILPQEGDQYPKVYLRVFLHSIELKNSNFEVKILKSKLHEEIDEENEKQREVQLRIQEQRRLDKLKQMQEKEKLRKEREEERMRQERIKLEESKRRKEETMKRAQEALVKAKEAREKEILKMEEERKMRKEMRTGGGFNMALHRAKMEEKAKEEAKQEAKQE